MKIQKIITIKDVDLTALGNRILYTVPNGAHFTMTSIIFTTSIAPAASGDGAFRIQRKSDHADMLNGYYSSTSVIGAINTSVEKSKTDLAVSVPVIDSEDQIELIVETIDSGSVAKCDIDIIGYESDSVVMTQGAKGYTNKTKIENYLLITIDDIFNSVIDDWIADIEVYMDGETQRVLGVPDSSVETTALYDGNNKTSLMIDDFVSISKVMIGDEDVTSEVFFEPANSTPLWKLQTKYKLFPKDIQNVKVTGVQGYAKMSDLPRDISLAATILVSGIINQQNDLESSVSSETIGRYTVTYSNEKQKKDFSTALETLKAYKRIR